MMNSPAPATATMSTTVPPATAITIDATTPRPHHSMRLRLAPNQRSATKPPSTAPTIDMPCSTAPKANPVANPWPRWIISSGVHVASPYTLNSNRNADTHSAIVRTR